MADIKIASLSRHAQFKILAQSAAGGVNERLPLVTNGLVAHFPFDLTLKPTPLLSVTADQMVGTRHPVYGDLILPSDRLVVPLPALASARYIVAEFDAFVPTGVTGKMPIGFVNNSDINMLNIFNNNKRLGLNGWSSQDYGATVPLDQRVTVTYIIDTADASKSREYYNGVPQTMAGRAVTGARGGMTKVVFGDGRADANTGYRCNFYIGNFSIYTCDPEPVTSVEAVLERDGWGVFVGQPSTDIGLENVTLLRSGVIITNLGGGRWRIDNSAGTAFDCARLYWPTGSLDNGETYTTSLKHARISGGAPAYLLGDFCDIVFGSRKSVAYPGHTLETASAARGDYSAVYRFTDLSVPVGSIYEIWDIQLTKSFHAPGTEATPRTSSLSRLSLGDKQPLPTSHTLVGTQRSIGAAANSHYTVVRDGGTFSFYENGALTTTYENKWSRQKYHRSTVNYTFAGADNLKENLGDLPDSNYGIYYSYNADKCGYLMRTFVYSDADVRIWHRYGMDNGGYIRVNGRDVQNCGGYASATNPDVFIDLKIGWNCVELWGSDGDSGGTIFSLVNNTQGFNENNTTSLKVVASVRLSAHPNVKYQSSRMPVDYFTTNVAPMTFTRSTAALVEGISYPVNTPRFVRVGGTMGLLSEEYSTNVLASARADLSTWANYYATGGSAGTRTFSTDAKYGSVCRLTKTDAGAGRHAIKTTFTGLVGERYSVSLMARPRSATGRLQVYVDAAKSGGGLVTLGPGWNLAGLITDEWQELSMSVPPEAAGLLAGTGTFYIWMDTSAGDCEVALPYLASKPYYSTAVAPGVIRQSDVTTIPTENVIKGSTGTIVVDWICDRPGNSITSQAFSPEILQIGNYYQNASLTLWAMTSSSLGATPPHLQMYIKGASNAGWSVSPTLQAGGTNWYTPNTKYRFIVTWTGGNTFYVYSGGTKYGPYTIADPVTAWSGNKITLGDGIYPEMACYDRMLSDAELSSAYAGNLPGDFTLHKVFTGAGVIAGAGDGIGYTPGFNGWAESLSLYDRAVNADEISKLGKPTFNLSKDGRLTTAYVVEAGENLWPNQDMLNNSYGVPGGPSAVIGADEFGAYHQMTISNGGYAYKGFNITNSANTVYTFSADVWVSAGHTFNYRAIQVEQSSSNVGVDFSAIPTETWVRVAVRTYDVNSGFIRFLIYPTAGSSGQVGVIRWRNVVVREEPAVPMKAAQKTLTVGEIIEA